jgi:hypothetical protein
LEISYPSRSGRNVVIEERFANFDSWFRRAPSKRELVVGITFEVLNGSVELEKYVARSRRETQNTNGTSLRNL